MLDLFYPITTILEEREVVIILFLTNEAKLVITVFRSEESGYHPFWERDEARNHPFRREGADYYPF